MKCKIEGCTNSEDLNFGALRYHLRNKHGYSYDRMRVYLDNLKKRITFKGVE